MLRTVRGSDVGPDGINTGERLFEKDKVYVVSERLFNNFKAMGVVEIDAPKAEPKPQPKEQKPAAKKKASKKKAVRKKKSLRGAPENKGRR